MTRYEKYKDTIRKGGEAVVVWRWTKNVIEYVGKSGVIRVKVAIYDPSDISLYGRDGWVGFKEDGQIPDNTYSTPNQIRERIVERLRFEQEKAQSAA